MQQVFEYIFDLYGIVNNNGYLKEIDGKILNEQNFTVDTLIGQKISDTEFFNIPSFTESILENILSNAENGQETKLIQKLSFRNPKYKNFELTFVPLKKNGDSTGNIFFGAKDISYKENEVIFYKERSEHFLYAAENAGIGLWFWDLKKDEIFSTPKCNKIFDLPPFEIFQLEKFFKIVHPDDLSRVEAELRKSHENGDDYTLEFRLIYLDGNIHWIAARGKTFFDTNNEPLSMMGSVRRITDQKMASEELATIYEREKKASSEAVQANKAKDFFLAVVSHELRSPLNSILGWTKILLSREVDEETRLNALETIERSAKSQSKLIDDLLDSARVTSGKLKLEMRPVNLYQIIQNIYNAKRPEAEAKNINLEFQADNKDAEVFGDTVRLQQVFLNILSNAVKFTPEGGQISIQLIQSNDNALVSIQDNGRGINIDEIETIFDQFSQAKNGGGGNNLGLGLGLSIAKILVQKHDGEITVQSAGTNKGSTFTVSLPLITSDSDVAEEIANNKSADEISLHNLQILVVEDDYDSRNVLQLFLEQLGAVVESADSAKEALNILDNQILSPDLIISDIAMPEEDGNSLIKKIRSSENTRHRDIPAIALSAFTALENREKAINSGFQIYHTKPFDPDILIQEIKQLAK